MRLYLFFTVLLTAVNVNAATVSTDGSSIVIRGDIDTKTIKIRSGGGSVRTAIEIADLVYQKDLDVEVMEYCTSACTLILLSGKHRIAKGSTYVGVHRPYKNLHGHIVKAGRTSETYNEIVRVLSHRFSHESAVAKANYMWSVSPKYMKRVDPQFGFER